MSFWIDPTSSLRQILDTLKIQGFAVFTSANNYSEDACTKTPANWSRSKDGPVITVGGTMLGQFGDGRVTGDLTDYRWQEYERESDGKIKLNSLNQPIPLTGIDSGSNYGPCVDIWAPAKGIRVASYGSVVPDEPYTGTNSRVLSGTSFSSPLAAAIGARWFVKNPLGTPDGLWNWMQQNTTKMVVQDVKTTSHGDMLYHVDSCRDRLVSTAPPPGCP